MPNRLADAVSPYLRSHADNPVDWRQWGAEAFEEAARRDVPVLVSIGYSTCHWCHVMARESFSDPALAAYLNEHFVAVKVDREEHPDVDSSYLAAAGAFTENLGWPLNVFVTPRGGAFFAGTYWPPVPQGGHPTFRQVLEAVIDAWKERRDAVEGNAAELMQALAEQVAHVGSELPDGDALARSVRQLLDREDGVFGGFGTAPKFPVVPVLLFLLDRGSLGDGAALDLAERTLVAMAGSPLRDRDGGFFRYATRRDWSEPHYERMLYDNAQLLSAYTRLSLLSASSRTLAGGTATGIAGFLLATLRLPGGAFASAQDSESIIDGERVEGRYYLLDAEARATLAPPALDDKVLTGWNGLAIDALVEAGSALGRADWVDAARAAADYLLAHHLVSPEPVAVDPAASDPAHVKESGALIRASVADRPSAASATLEDYGMLAGALLHVGEVTGEVRYASVGRRLVDATLADAGSARGGTPFAVPGGADPVLVAQGVAIEADPSEGAYPSGSSAMASAAHRLYLLTAESRYLDAATAVAQQLAPLALRQPIAFGGALGLASALAAPTSQLVVVGDSVSPLASVARRWYRGGSVSVQVTDAAAAEFADAGFELFEARSALDSMPTAYLCRDFVCRLPLTAPADLLAALEDAQRPS
ncbi:thioredoxin domain-containing protein [Parafrigoribacterium soli]|uniref:thioredoxin domain-containing protein n=1 Tax=Parafrigoribacterium soli TaxID=3144663 RepID=UPI0032ED9953